MLQALDSDILAKIPKEAYLFLAKLHNGFLCTFRAQNWRVLRWFMLQMELSAITTGSFWVPEEVCC
jgi:hypothetical protein